MPATSICSSSLCVAAATPEASRAARSAAALRPRAVAKTAGRVLSIACEARKAQASPSAIEATLSKLELPAAAKPAIMAAVANIVAAGPAQAGVLFDFNLTLPVIMAQFLVLMVILDKTLFTPVGEKIDKRNALLAKGSDYQAGTEITEIKDKTKATIKASRDEKEKILAEMKAEIEAKDAKVTAEAKEKLQVQFDKACADMQGNVDGIEKSLEDQVDTYVATLAKKLEPSGAREAKDFAKQIDAMTLKGAKSEVAPVKESVTV